MMKLILKYIFTLHFISFSALVFSQTHVVISQVYGGGGNASAQYKNDFVELYNPTAIDINISTWSVQYASSTGNFSAVTNLSGTLAAGKYYLVQLGTSGAIGANLPTPEATGTTNISASNGKVALVSNTTALGVSNPPASNYVDLVGYGTANYFEGAAAAAAGSNTLSITRIGNIDTDANSVDFSATSPNPRNSTFTVLATTLENFSASKTNNGINVNWLVGCLGSTVTFELQRSYNAINFTTFYSATETKLRCESPFDYKDANAGNGTIYYRLKVIDLDGGVRLSNIAVVENGNSQKNKVTVSPTIATTFAELYYSSTKAEKVNWVINDMQGRQVKSISTLVTVGNNKITIPVATLTQGQYLIKGFTSAGNTDAAVFMKQ